jgi:hypothetical protein
LTEFDIRNSLRALANVGVGSSKERQGAFEHLLLSHRRAVMAQMKGDVRSRVTAKLSDEETVVMADALRESGMYPDSRFTRKMQLFKEAIEGGARLNEAWNIELHRKKAERRSSASYSQRGGEEEYNDDHYEQREDDEDLEKEWIS